MKTTLLFVGIIILSFGSSCRRCAVCKKHGESLQKICRDSYNSDGDYNQALNNEENNGFVCL